MNSQPEAQIEAEKEAPQKKRSHWRRRSPRVKFLLPILIILLVILFIQFLQINPWRQTPPMYVVELTEFKLALDQAIDPVIVDIRPESEYTQSHLPGAIWGAKDACTEYGVALCEKKKCKISQPYFFYSDHGEDYHEVRRAIDRTGDRQCWSEVYMLDGGFDAWVEAGYEVISE